MYQEVYENEGNYIIIQDETVTKWDQRYNQEGGESKTTEKETEKPGESKT
jgi:hypothetical protein